MIKLLKLFHNNLPIRATKTGGFSMYLSESSPIGTQTNLDTLMQFEQSENYDLSFLANVSELRYVDAVRMQVRTRILKNTFYLWYRRYHFLL